MVEFSDYFRNLFSLLPYIHLKNIIDILLITVIFYKIFSLIKNTKAEQLFKGFASIIIVMKLSELLGFTALTWIIKNTLSFGVIAFIIIFQPEFRSILEHIGRSMLLNKRKSITQENLNMVEHIVEAVFELSRTKTGALIIISRITKLNDYIIKGTQIDAIVTSSFLINAFVDGTPLHDGAIIIEDDRIKAANCVLPLSEKPLANIYGTRHRAALGISEQCDAVSIVVSEETRKISICVGGKLKMYKDKNEFKNDLNNLLNFPDEDSNILGRGGKIWNSLKKKK